ncbi:hypothetical protein [Legionella septentrionalis]|uniref:hypothetical protein n=1 Tax=Legionella septentrionalis TaxID=2498109 RepID=UPI000F8EB29B|nr:hypothetical protein [Legionella septentrionalis]RUR00638.1 hypothetical protein ELY11_02490 [Legionella septentrionalis]
MAPGLPGYGFPIITSNAQSLDAEAILGPFYSRTNNSSSHINPNMTPFSPFGLALPPSTNLPEENATHNKKCHRVDIEVLQEDENEFIRSGLTEKLELPPIPAESPEIKAEKTRAKQAGKIAALKNKDNPLTEEKIKSIKEGFTSSIFANEWEISYRKHATKPSVSLSSSSGEKTSSGKKKRNRPKKKPSELGYWAGWMAASVDCNLKSLEELTAAKGKEYAEAYHKGFDTKMRETTKEERLLKKAYQRGYSLALDGRNLPSVEKLSKIYNTDQIEQYKKGFAAARKGMSEKDISAALGKINGKKAALAGFLEPTSQDFKKQNRDQVYQENYLNVYREFKKLYGDLDYRTYPFYRVDDVVIASFYSPEFLESEQVTQLQQQSLRRAAYLFRAILREYNKHTVDFESDKLVIKLVGPFVVINNYDALMEELSLADIESLPPLSEEDLKYWNAIKNRAQAITTNNILDDDFFDDFMTEEEVDKIIEKVSAESLMNKVISAENQETIASSSTSVGSREQTPISLTPFNFFSPVSSPVQSKTNHEGSVAKTGNSLYLKQSCPTIE